MMQDLSGSSWQRNKKIVKPNQKKIEKKNKNILSIVSTVTF
jgi:hypothetical protein